MAPVVLQMDVHCLGCARKIRKAIKNLYGVESVWASPDTGLVVVAGWADASALQSRIQYKIRRPVTIVSDGAEPLQPDWHPHAMPPPHLGPRHYAAPWPPQAYRYERRYMPATRQYYMPPAGEPSVCFDDERPNGCCVQ